jgi:MFS family permease
VTAEAPPRRGLGMLIGVLVSAVDGTIVVLALPVIREDLKISLAAVTWVVVGYLLVVTVLATQLGRFGDLFCRMRMYQAGFVVFTIGSILCALAWSGAAVTAARARRAAPAAVRLRRKPFRT